MKLGWENPALTLMELGGSAEIFKEVGEQFPFSLNAYSLANNFSIIEDVINIIDFETITEVGVFKGEFSKCLIKHVKNKRKKLNFIDVHFKDGIVEELSNLSNSYEVQSTFIEDMSVNALNQIEHSDITILDGDHNLETVSKELYLAHLKSAKCIILDDTGWPCNVWDVAYNVDNLEDKMNYMKGEISPFSDDVLEENGLVFEFLRYSKGQTGITVAIDNFIDKHPEYRLFSVSSFFGMTILWNTKKVTSSEHYNLMQIDKSYSGSSKLIKTFELNRLMMLIKMQDNGKVWSKMKAYISKLESQLDR